MSDCIGVNMRLKFADAYVSKVIERDTEVRDMGVSQIIGDMLHEEGNWSMVSTKLHTIVGNQGWKSVIRHDCETVGSPYWMLLEYHVTPTLCVYCQEAMPDGIVSLFKFLNSEVMR
jgi:hypothetical protein